MLWYVWDRVHKCRCQTSDLAPQNRTIQSRLTCRKKTAYCHHNPYHGGHPRFSFYRQQTTPKILDPLLIRAQVDDFGVVPVHKCPQFVPQLHWFRRRLFQLFQLNYCRKLSTPINLNTALLSYCVLLFARNTAPPIYSTSRCCSYAPRTGSLLYREIIITS